MTTIGTTALVVLFAVYFALAEYRIARATKQRRYWYERCVSLSAIAGQPIDDEQESCEPPEIRT